MPRKFTWAEQALMDLVRAVAVIWPFSLGVAILVSGEVRFQSPSWRTLMDWAPYWAWGLMLVFFGLMSLCRSFRVSFAGYALIAAWAWVWAAAFVVNLLVQPESALTGIPSYGAIAAVYTGFAVACWMDRENHV